LHPPAARRSAAALASEVFGLARPPVATEMVAFTTGQVSAARLGWVKAPRPAAFADRFEELRVASSCRLIHEDPMKILTLTLAAMLGIALGPAARATVKSVVLVHGAFADGSGWKPVADLLEHDGYSVYVAQIPETTFEADVAATKSVLDRSGPCVLVGHSYGGMVITEAGVHASVKSLVYVAAFQPNVGESAGELNGKTPPASNDIAPVGGGFLQVKPESFSEDFAADLPKPLAHFMAISQVPIATQAFTAKATAAAWSNKPSYAVVAQQDRMINPELERFMTRRAKSETIELPGSHALYVSHAKDVAALIEKAARAAK
jgi:pimeloyl-ACP methyl ester carboxylesterase